MILIVTEKESVSVDIAKVVGASQSNEGFYEGNGYRVSWAKGHLFELAMPEDYSPTLKKWQYDTLPIIPEKFKYNLQENKGYLFSRLKSLMNGADVSEIICATDAGREGQLILHNCPDFPQYK